MTAQETAEAEEAWGFPIVVDDASGMSLPRFEFGDEIVVGEDVLRDSHTPETLIECDEEISVHLRQPTAHLRSGLHHNFHCFPLC